MGILRFGRVLLGHMVEWRMRRASVVALQALDDQTLKDIGLHRSQIVGRVEEMIEEQRRRSA